MVSSAQGPGALARRVVAAWLLLTLSGIQGAAIAEALSLGRSQGECCSQCKTECHCRRSGKATHSEGPAWSASGRCEDNCGCRRTLLTFRIAPVLPPPRPAERVLAVSAYLPGAESPAAGASCYPAFLYQRPPPCLPA